MWRRGGGGSKLVSCEWDGPWPPSGSSGLPGVREPGFQAGLSERIPSGSGVEGTRGLVKVRGGGR